MNINILDFLMENEVILKCLSTGNCMTADEAFELGGELVVYDNTKQQNDLYRGLDFEKAVKIMNGDEQ